MENVLPCVDDLYELLSNGLIAERRKLIRSLVKGRVMGNEAVMSYSLSWVFLRK